MNTSRRAFLGALVAVASSSALAAAQQGKPFASSSDKEIRPYREVGPFPEDDGWVQFFFDFGCGHCRNYHALMSNWGASLPVGYLKARFVPVVATKDDIAAAAAYFMMEARAKGDRERLANQMESGYAEIQDKLASKGDVRMWSRLVGNITDSEALRRKVVGAGVALRKYEIRKTPSIAVGGKYVITPDDAGGDPQTFLQLMNGVASMVLAEKGYRPS